MEKRPIMIIAAMEKTELNVLKEDNMNVVIDGTCKFYETEIYGYPVVLCASNVGCINTSVAMILGIKKYNPIAIINEGLAGAMSKDIHKHDLIIGTQLININSAKTPKLQEGDGTDALKWELVTFIAGEEDRLKVEEADKKLIDCVKKVEREYTKGKVVYGRIGSGDIWNNEIDRILYLNQKYQVLCEDMESIAVYQIANQYNIPVISIKIISDNSITGEEYDVSTGSDAQYFVKILIKEYVKELN